jgi:hypothetical protein
VTDFVASFCGQSIFSEMEKIAEFHKKSKVDVVADLYKKCPFWGCTHPYHQIENPNHRRQQLNKKEELQGG